MVLQSPPAAIPPGETRRLIFDSIKTNKDKVFMIDGLSGTKLTYRELFEKAVSVAIFLNKSGVGDGSYVGVLSDASLVSNIFLTGVWLSGATLCPMNPTGKPEEILQLLDICKAKFLFCQEKYLAVLEAALLDDDGDTTTVTDVQHETYIDVRNILNEDPAEFRMGSYDPEESITHVLFTSGTTGVPKGVICNSRSAKVIAFRFRMKDAFMCTSPLYWTTYIAFLISTLVHGCTLIVPRTKYIPGTNDVDLTHILDCVQKYKPCSWFTGPSVLLELCTIPSSSTYDSSSLRRVTVGGAHFLPSHRRQICDKLFNGRNIVVNAYGATEVGMVTYWAEIEGPDHDSPLAASLGRLVTGITLKVEDVDTGAELGPGETGEFVVKSAAIMKGYTNHPERYTPDDWYRMGDLGYYDEEGYIFFSSRLKEIMKYRGLQIAPVELEKVIIKHPQVHDVCVVGRPHGIDGERPAAFVVRKSSSLTEKDLHNFVDERVSDSKKLRGGVFFVESIPKNAIGKTLRRDLVKLLEEMGDE